MADHPELAIGASLTGSLFEYAVKSGVRPSLLVVDRPCKAIEIAEAAGIDVLRLMRREFYVGKVFDRERFTMELVTRLQGRGTRIFAMMGFMTELGDAMFEESVGIQIINTHPALLPAFRGATAVADTLAFGSQVTGFTIHRARRKLDEARGGVLAQGAVYVDPTDTVDTLQEKIKKAERPAYVEVLRKLLAELADRAAA